MCINTHLASIPDASYSLNISCSRYALTKNRPMMCVPERAIAGMRRLGNATRSMAQARFSPAGKVQGYQREIRRFFKQKEKKETKGKRLETHAMICSRLRLEV